MSKIVSIDLNYSSNSAPHSASVSTIAGPVGGGVTIKKPVQIGGVEGGATEELCVSHARRNTPITFFGQDSIKINRLLKNYIIDEIETVTGPRVTKTNYKLVDIVSANFLDNITVLVRGISSAPIGNNNYSYEGRVYEGSELPASAKNINTGSVISPDSPFYDKKTKILFIGHTRSVFSPNDLGGTKQEFVYENGAENKKASFANEPGDTTAFINERLKPQRTSVSLRYGYTIQQFKKAVETKIGLRLEGLDILDRPLADELHRLDTFVNFTGTLRSCISSIAALLGLYWYVDINSRNKVVFINRKAVRFFNNTIELFNDGSENKIISKTEREKGFGPNLVLSFFGSTDPPEPISIRRVFQATGSDLVKTKFWRVPAIEKLFGQEGVNSKVNYAAIKYFFDFFMLSERVSEENFRNLFAGFLVTAASTALSNNVGSIYDSDNDFAVEKEGSWSDVKSDFLTVTNEQIDVDGLKDSSEAYAIRTNQGNKKKETKFEDPDEYFAFLRGFYEIYGKLYISNSFPADNDNSRVVTSSSMTISGPFHKTKKIKDVGVNLLDRFVEIAELGGVDAKETTIGSLVSMANLSVGEYHYVGEKNTPPRIGSSKEPVNDEDAGATSNIDLVLSRIDTVDSESVGGFSSWRPEIFISASNIKTAIHNVFQSSSRHFDSVQFDKSLTAFKDVAVEKENDATEDDPPTQSPEDAIPELDFNNTVYKVNASNVDDPRKSQLIQFNGPIQDVNALMRNVGEITEQYPEQISISKTYYGLVVPKITPTLDSVSINVGEDGVNTTISRSTKQLLPIDQNIIIDRERQVFSPTASSQFSAAQKNVLKL